MTRSLPADCETLGEVFGLGPRCLKQQVHGSGHIHDTIYAAYEGPRGIEEVIHQRINTAVFRDPPALMRNIVQVSSALVERQRKKHPADWTRRALRVMQTPSGEVLHRDADGGWWRTYHYISDSLAHDQIGSPAHAEAAAYAFGEFSSTLARFEGPKLCETIDGFHDTPARWQGLLNAMRDDRVGRLHGVRRELDALDRLSQLRWKLAQPLASGDLPLRIAHNDTKLNNVLFDRVTNQALCVVDLDTVMPGTMLFDFGDLVRSSTSNRTEDGEDGSEATVDETIFAALVRGWFRACGQAMTKVERELMVASAQVLAFEVAVRFLTDFLQGDVYFRVAHAEHNLRRSRAQLELTQALVKQSARLESIVARTWRDVQVLNVD